MPHAAVLCCGWLGTFSLLACGAGSPAGQDAAPSDLTAILPTCAKPGGLFPIDARGDAHPLGSEWRVPVILGFQGFLFVQFALRSPYQVSSAVPLRSKLIVGDIERQTTHADVSSLPVDGENFDTRDITVFFNDFALGDLVGRSVSIDVEATMKECTIELHAEGTLIDGSGADGGVPDR